jgi:hypothetical protein
MTQVLDAYILAQLAFLVVLSAEHVVSGLALAPAYESNTPIRVLQGVVAGVWVAFHVVCAVWVRCAYSRRPLPVVAAE